ncbi:MAG: 16S rRNA (cytosine(1402)-N(4))-methyltransferase RsmH [Microscillaceae bacterium]
MTQYHKPVLESESLQWLAPQPGGVYLDLTFGGGGHARAILARLEPEGQLLAFDQDPDAAREAEKISAPHFQFFNTNFTYFRRYLKLLGIEKVQGVFADLGVSSHQFDTAERGFSTRFTGPLDMRMDIHQPLTAAQVLNEYSEADLQNVLRQYGEIKNAHRLAQALIRARSQGLFADTAQLREAALPYASKNRENKYLAQVFQALRIEVNQELKVLETLLLDLPQVLAPGGRAVIIAYHSLEDRLVKHFFQTGNLAGTLHKDFYGNIVRPLAPLTRKPVLPSETEIADNPRARSARLRVAERVEASTAKEAQI